MKISIVILNYNGKRHMERFLPSVVQHTTTADTEIVIADNCSTDDSIQFLKSTYPQLRLIQLDKNYGFAGGYNKALAQIEAEYFILLNSDVEVTAGWVENLEKIMDEQPEVAACQPKIMALNDRARFEHAGACGGFIDRLGYPFCRGRLFSSLEEDKGQYDTIREVFWATGACLFIRSKEFFDAGGFDDTFFAHMEEIDLCWRLKSRGRSILCIPQSTVYHLGGGSMSAKNSRKTYLNFRNNWSMLYKNMTDEELQKIALPRFVLDYVAAMQMLLTGQFKHALQVPKARKDYKALRKDLAAKRETNLRLATVAKPSGVLTKSLLRMYYLQGKKCFSQLENLIR
ncbi:glycosyltransferase family 2 protein [Paludibacter sp.]|uniref:glycosyltransferase family 2 protein n=1 Tax=Paludibacter sp. TaxID=1898105 RepID=UPI0013561BC2|nr:glycosyltransferase family 2 protein [Paludibacter sp.]MTK54276.1 glycosyltransferase family 2 protein [Paludibacter sp.]